ncbi:hypothetical protein [Amycolatopsis nalaikhensis]|uniref:Uncharacterized protein n=2 Tax=Amycolatopsis TaxID=1813 RepID=A0ABY8XH37_9PSEU|nr:hypothetical protein [Amycolatopsis sp. 2-2]WIV54902.1 hypothetical protein QP939_39680 [Amycolatopsis sp. 2-2]
MTATAPIRERSETESIPPNPGTDPESPPRSRLLGLCGYLFLFVWPPAVLLQVWFEHLPGWLYGVLLTCAVLFYGRVLLNMFTAKLASAEAKKRGSLDGSGDVGAVEELANDLRDDLDVISVEHLQQFAWSLLTPAAVRRRVTDEYTPDHRTLRKSVTIEFSFDRRFHQWPAEPDHRAAPVRWWRSRCRRKVSCTTTSASPMPRAPRFPGFSKASTGCWWRKPCARCSARLSATRR